MPHELPLLRDLLVLLLAAVPIAFLLNRLRLPVIVGFMVTGILIGPYGFGLIRDVAAVDALAEIGVVLLLFTIGLEFSLRRIIEMKRLVLWGGGLQVLMTILLMSALAYAFGRTGRQAVFIGFLFALSSTAIVLKSYFDRAEIDAPHGRAAIAILLFQDLSESKRAQPGHHRRRVADEGGHRQQHADGDEKDAVENVSEGQQIRDDLVAVLGIRQNQAGDKRTQCQR